MEPRLPAHLEVSALIRQVEAAGGFAMVLSKGERDAGTILVVLTQNGGNSRAYERMPQADGSRQWCQTFTQDPEKPWEFSEILTRWASRDPDLWIVELDIANGERFIGLSR